MGTTRSAKAKPAKASAKTARKAVFAAGARSKGRPENMRPVRTEAEAKAKGRRGGIASGKARRQKKLLSQIYADFLIETHNVEIGDKKKTLSGEALVKHVAETVLVAGGGPAVSLMKEMREATEGSKVTLDGPISIGLPPEPPKGAPDA